VTPALLLSHAAASLYMTGLIWFVQLSHYPLIARVGAAELPTWQAENLQRTTWAVGPPMLLELATTVVLVVWRPEGVSATLAWLGAGLLAAIWLSTAVLQVPFHQAILDGDTESAVARLVRSNWLRTALWSARGAVALALVAGRMR
jgi:hypothetical protein